MNPPKPRRGHHLIVTVGGATNVPKFVIEQLQPEQIHFLYTAQTKRLLETDILPGLHPPCPPDHLHEVNANNPNQVCETTRAVLRSIKTTDPIAVYCDATSGTTAMGIGVAIAALELEARMTYVEWKRENQGTDQPEMILHHLELPRFS